jgi:phage shock protein A
MGFFADLFSRRAHECAVEADKWTKRARAARQAGHGRLATDCETYARRFRHAGDRWRQSGREAHQAHLRATDQDTSTALRPTRTKGHWWD